MTRNVRILTLADIPTFTLADADVAECAACGMTPTEAVRSSVERSTSAWVMEAEGEVLMLGGYAPRGFLTNAASVWMLGTPLASPHAVAVARVGQSFCAYMLNTFHSIYVNVHRRHRAGRRWAKFLGFEIESYSGEFLSMRLSRSDR